MFKIAKFLLVIVTFIFISACSADKEEVAPDAPTSKPNAVVYPTVQTVSKPAYEKTFSHPDEVLAELDKHNIITCQTREKLGASYDVGDTPIGGLEQEYLTIKVLKNGRFDRISIPTLECALESERDNLVATYGPETRGPWIHFYVFDDIEQSDSYKNSCTLESGRPSFCTHIKDDIFFSNVLINITAIIYDESSKPELVHLPVDSILEDLAD